MSLTRQVQALPPELFKQILDYTVLPNTGGVVHINRDYRPPVGLSINRATRTEVAHLHYGTRTFQLIGDFDSSSSNIILVAWLKSLPVKHREITSKIHCPCQIDKTCNNTPLSDSGYLTEKVNAMREIDSCLETEGIRWQRPCAVLILPRGWAEVERRAGATMTGSRRFLWLLGRGGDGISIDGRAQWPITPDSHAYDISMQWARSAMSSHTILWLESVSARHTACREARLCTEEQ
ncbi:hypothetical protein CLAFUW4_11879 [Fulvia fulva]|nr:hypothetical protein CLAFUR4_11884 [Fulvia fulva]KAK4618429.1 hypothetical protein CLAFUR0_11897 [Fulvia fulva]WPV18194.1 hypothetical protein CLAFUW4_11879 [Fulvia fulva]WPV32932.1 hypothetical protein CLAFUW7_11886 [Fulvia fulva]